jgi:CheY-like chemotaxis protein
MPLLQALDSQPTPPGVLIVDDEKPIVDLLTRYLGQHGFRTIGAYSAEEARDRVLSDPAIGVVFSDVRMPGQSGLALAEELVRGRPDTAALEVVLITGASLPEDGGTPVCAFDVLRKPFRPSEVAQTAARALASCEQRRLRAAREAAPRPSTLRPASPQRLAELAGVAAEALRAPILPILAAAEALEAGRLLGEAEIRDHARRIREESRRLLALIDAAGTQLASTPAAPEPPGPRQAVAGTRLAS